MSRKNILIPFQRKPFRRESYRRARVENYRDDYYHRRKYKRICQYSNQLAEPVYSVFTHFFHFPIFYLRCCSGRWTLPGIQVWKYKYVAYSVGKLQIIYSLYLVVYKSRHSQVLCPSQKLRSDIRRHAHGKHKYAACITPGALKGNVTFTNVCTGFAPRLVAAFSTFLSMDCITPVMASII